MKKKALVTGATGFVGSNLCLKLISEGWEVYIISRKGSKYESIKNLKENINIYEYDGNLLNLSQYLIKINVNVVFHLASSIIIEHEPMDIYKLMNGNLKFGMEILEAMKISKTSLIINTGTYWQNYHSLEYNPVNLYAATKEAFEKIIKYYVEAEKIRCITLKLFDTYSENDTRPKLINLLNKFADEKIELDMSKGEQELDLIHVNDVIDAFIKSYEYLIENKDIKYEEFGVGTGKKINLKEVIDIFEKISRKKIKINWGKRAYRKREVMKIWKSYKLLLNWKVRISLEEGLKKNFE